MEHIYECYHFEKKEPFLKSYMQVLSYLKLKYSVSKENEPSFFHKLNSKMEFSNLSLELTPENVEEDDMLKDHFKLLMNCALGKFAQKKRKTKTHFLRNQVNIKVITSIIWGKNVFYFFLGGFRAYCRERKIDRKCY